MAVYDCTNEAGLDEGIEMASDSVRAGKIVVIPTDTVYGVGCDAFSPEAVTAVLDAKGRGRDMPPPVLVPSARTVDGLAIDVPGWARDLMEEFWPGALTIVLRSHTSLVWDLGDTNGTVALRMPQDPIALRLLSEVGPMAVTSANRTGSPAATTAIDAATQLGSAVEVYLDGGPREAALASTIVDCTGAELVVLREGAISRAELDVVIERSRAASEPEPVPEPGPAAGEDPVSEAEDVSTEAEDAGTEAEDAGSEAEDVSTEAADPVSEAEDVSTEAEDGDRGDTEPASPESPHPAP